MAPESDPRAAEIRQALTDHPEWTDRQIAKALDINRWSRVSRQREWLAARAPAPPDSALVCPHVGCGFVAKTPGGLAVHEAGSHRRPAEIAAALSAALPEPEPRQPVIAPNPTIVCLNCSRVGTPSPSRPTWCKACAGPAEAAAWRERTLWQCSCGRPFARSTSNPGECIKCSGEYDRVASRHRYGAVFAAAD